MSRPGKGVEHVESLEGPREVKERLKVVLRTITGETSIEEASRELGVSEARLHEIRKEALEGALQALEPRPPGRPPSPRPDPEVEALRIENRRLERELEAARIRTEIALVMPHVLRPAQADEKKGPGGRPGGRSVT